MNSIRLACIFGSFTLFAVQLSDQFRIPLPFGAIDVNKNPDGTLDFGANSNINILGYGANSGLNFTSKNGSFGISPGFGAIVKNQTYGSNSSLAVDQNRGFGIDSDVNLGKKAIHGGLGKEAQFISEAARLGQQNQQHDQRPHSEPQLAGSRYVQQVPRRYVALPHP